MVHMFLMFLVRFGVCIMCIMCIRAKGGAENDGPSKCPGIKLTDMKLKDQMSRHENDGPSKCPGMKLTDMKLTDMKLTDTKMQDMFQVSE